MNKSATVVATLAIVSPMVGATAAQQQTAKKMSAEAARGKHLAQIAGCNDCHTPGYTLSGGKVEEKLWLTGDRLGWRGPRGTTYPAYLKHLGPAGEPAPQYVPPDKTPSGPFVQFPAPPK